MRLFLKILRISSIVIICFLIVLFSASLLLQDKAARVIIKSFNSVISTKFEIAAIKLSLIRSFPDATLELRNVTVHSSPGFDRSGFKGKETDTLLSARSVSMQFNIASLIRENYNIERITIRDGFINLLSDSLGKVNYSVSVKGSPEDQETGFTLNLEKINLRNINISYDNISTRLETAGFIEEARLKSRISGDQIDFSSEGKLSINHFSLYEFNISQPVYSGFMVSLKSSEKGISFGKSTLTFDGNVFSLSGTVSGNNDLDLTLTGENIDLSGIMNYLPREYRSRMLDYNPAGKLKIVGRISGPVSETANPGIAITCDLSDGSVTYLNSPLTLRDLSFSCIFNNGSGHVPATSTLSVSSFKATIGSAEYTGSLTLSDFDNPRAFLVLKGTIIPDELREYFGLKEIAWAEGSIDMNLRLDGPVARKKSYSFKDFLDLDPVSELKFNSFGIGLRKTGLKISRVSGDLFSADTVALKNLKFNFRDHDITINGTMRNLPGWISGDPVILYGSGKISCKNLRPEVLFPSTPAGNSSETNQNAVMLPGDIVFDLGFDADTFIYKNFSAGKVKGTVSYKPGILNFKTLTFNSMDGTISCNGLAAQNGDNSFIGRGSFTVQNINVRKAFRSFGNFGQTFITAENIDGELSGKFSVLMPFDSILNPVIRTLSAEGKYTLTRGELVNFEPVKSLSSYIELTELEDIRFDKLENDFFIKNNYLYTPQMDIKSTAADFTVNGRHNFDNDYEYHIKILLSQLLSKKLKKPKPNTTEFGAVKDDGLGRTSLLLRLEGSGEDIKVAYDVKAAGEVIRNNIKAERKNLKTILNEEYGWFKKDSVPKQSVTGTTPRFKITWGGSDTSSTESAPKDVRKEKNIKNIFKKK